MHDPDIAVGDFQVSAIGVPSSKAQYCASASPGWIGDGLKWRAIVSDSYEAVVATITSLYRAEVIHLPGRWSPLRPGPRKLTGPHSRNKRWIIPRGVQPAPAVAS